MVQPRDRVVLGLALLIVVSGLLVLAPSGAGQVFGPFEDTSGNDRDLTEDGNVVNVTGPFDKFGGGLDFSDGELRRTDAIWDLNGGLSLTLSFTVDGTDSESLVVYADGFDLRWAVRYDPGDSTIEFVSDDQLVATRCTITGVSPGDYSLYLWHNDRNVLNDQNRMQLYDASGLLDSCDNNFNAEEGTGELRLGVTDNSAKVWELRTWDTNIAEGTLDAIADPTNPMFTFEAEGSESALYLLEPFAFPGEPDPLNSVDMWIHKADGERMMFAQVINSTGFPIEAEEIDLFITRTNGLAGEYFSLSSGNWQPFPVANAMANNTATLFHVGLPDHFESDSTIRFTASAAISGPPEGTEDIALGTLDGDMSHDWLQEATIGALTLGDATWLLLWFAAFIFAARLQWLFAAGIAMFGALGGVVENPVVSPENPLLVIVLFFGATLLHIMHDWRASKGSTGAA